MGENAFPRAGHGAARPGDGPAAGEARCHVCGGLLARDADWCGQCYAPVRRGERAGAPDPGPGGDTLPAVPGDERAGRAPGAATAAAVATPGGGAVEITGGRASWDCPVCGKRNPIEAGLCGTCQTPFARLFEEPSNRPEIEPRTAAFWSLAFAGLGHWKVGLRADGVARMVLFAWTLGTVLVVIASRSGGGLGSSTPLFALYFGSAIAIYVLSAVDAYRIADGVPQLVTSRVLLWVSAALVLVSIALATLVTLPAARG